MHRLLPPLLCAALAFPLLAIAHLNPVADTTKQPRLTQAAFFADTTPLRLVLRSDFRQLKRKKLKGVFQPATASFTLPGGETLSGPVQIAPRGEFRRQSCAMPSLMVNFRSSTGSALGGLKKLKMVCGCRSNNYADELVLKEYLTYRLYNLLSDLSFRVRLVEVTYEDAAAAEKPYTQHAFFIEDVDAVAKRNGCIEFEKPITSSAGSNRHHLTLVCLFQYMIGNLDWSVPNRHNIKLVQASTDSLSLPYPIPYDFDFCGMVNAAYAFAQEEFREFQIEKVTDRMYRGFPSAPQTVEGLLQLFTEKKDSMYALIRGFDRLPKNEREGMLYFLDGFYRTAANKQDVKAIFVETSRKN